MNASAHIPDNSDLAKKIKDKANLFHDGKVSSYVRSCVEKDLSGTFTPTATTSLTDLARQFRPSLVEALIAAQIKQPSRVIDRLLEALVNALQRGDFNPDKEFHIYNHSLLALILSSRTVLESLNAAANGGDVEAAKKIVALTYKPAEEKFLAVAESAEAPVIEALKNRDKQASHSSHKPFPTPPKPTQAGQD